MIQAIIFDCYGVLVHESWAHFKHTHFAADPKRLQEATDLNKRVNAGLIGYVDFVNEVGNLANVSPKQVLSELDLTPVNTELFEFIQQELKPIYKLGLLSNAGDDRLVQLFSPDQLSLFDATVLSFEIGAVKPQPEAYDITASKLNVQNNECLFVDDKSYFCDGAEQAGMRAVQFRSNEQAIQAIRETLLSAS